MNAEKSKPREKMLSWLAGHPNIAELEKLGDEDLRLRYCEALTAAAVSHSARASRPANLSSEANAPVG